MSNAEQTAAAAEDMWSAARRLYETTKDPVTAIAARLGLTQLQLVHEARRRGWALRSTKTKKAAKPSTRMTLHTVRDTLQRRLAQFEQQIDELEHQASTVTTEKEIRAMNLLVRTLEKVLDLERKDRIQRHRLTRERKRLDDAAREELVRRIEALRPERDAGTPGAEARPVDGQ